MKPQPAKGSWISADCQQFVINFFLAAKIDDPLEVLLRRTYTEIIGKLLFYSGFTTGMHVLANCISSESGEPAILELDYLCIAKRDSDYITNALKARHSKVHSSYEAALPTYRHVVESDHYRVKGVRDGLLEQLNRCHPCLPNFAASQEWHEFFARINEGSSTSEDRSKVTCDCDAQDVMVIALSAPTKKLPTGNLGIIFLWKEKSQILPAERQLLQERLRPILKILSASVSRFLDVHYQVTADTYLPAYRRAGQKSVAVMFADIRNFTPTTEVLRNFGLVDELMAFMRDYCKVMGDVVVSFGGRVQAYAGDGIMAVFGEYMTSETRAVIAATNAAKKMCRDFQDLKTKFRSMAKIQKFFQCEYEPLDFALGIGINYGPVIFDYFGPANNRTFSQIGRAHV